MHCCENRFKGNRFVFVTLINLLVSLIEIILGIISQSLALVSDAFHNLEDTASVFISYIAWVYSFKHPTREKTYGYKRTEIIAAFVNSIFLIIISFFIIAEGVKRYFKPQPINSDLMIYASLFAFLVNLVSAILIHKDSHRNINWRSAYLHMLGDAFFSLSVVVCAFFIKRFSFYWLDPLLSFIIGTVMIYQGWMIFKRTFNILMQSSAALDYEGIKRDIESINGVKNIHHVHCWLNNENEIYFDAHIDIEDMPMSEGCVMLKKIEAILKEKYGIHHTTIQFETNLCSNKDMFHTQDKH